jgi:nucleoside-diphosphate-sugar epimerase
MTGLVLLTGATGFVGRQVLRALADRGAVARIVVREGKQDKFTGLKSIEKVIGTADLFAEGSAWWGDACSGIDTVIHTAWHVEPATYLQSPKNLDCLAGTLQLAKGAAQAGVKRFLGIGTCFEYDLAAGTLSVHSPLRPLTPYAGAKTAAFMALSQWLPRRGVEFAWCRLFYLYGEGENERRLVPYLRAKLMAGEPAELTSGRQVRDYLNVRDAGRMIVEAALGAEQGPVNICSGIPITVRQLAEQIADEYGRRDLLRFGARPDNLVDPPRVVGVRRERLKDGGHLKLLYTQEKLPVLQNRMYNSELEAKACPKGDIRLVEDQNSGLVYNADFSPELMNYDAHYQNEQAVSPLFQMHLESVSQIVDRCMGRESIVEIGCGKGVFLEMLLAKGSDVAGFDPAYEGTNQRVSKTYFAPGVGIKAKGLILRHVLEHIQNPFEFLLQLKEANGGSGRIYIEAPRFDWICEHRAWYNIFYEYVNYFRISDFYRMFGTVIESGSLFGRQYLFVVADLATLKQPELDVNDCVAFPQDFTSSITKQTGSGPAAVWGGAAKGVIFSLLKVRAGQHISTVIDINPAKQGKYLPSTGLLVRSPSDALATLPKGSTIYVMNSNYAEEIKEMSGHAYEYIQVGE